MNSFLTDFFLDKCLLVTGGSGFLASNLVEGLKDTRCTIRRLSRRGSRLSGLNGKAVVRDFYGDISDKEVWRQVLKGTDIVFHFAAQTSVYAANESPVDDFAANVLPIVQMLETCRTGDIHPAVLFAGTVTETGITTVLPVDENHPDNPVTVYDLHKLMAENYLKYYVSQGIVRGAVLRLANVYGPGQSSGTGRGVLNTMIEKAVNGELLSIYERGDYIRDYVYVGDVVEAFLSAGACMDLISGSHYVIGSGKGHSVRQAVDMVAERVRKKTGSDVQVVRVDPPSGMSPIEKRNFVADTKNFSSATGWTSRTSLEEGIDRTIDYFLSGTKAAL